MYSKELPSGNENIGKISIKNIITDALSKILSRAAAMFSAITIIICLLGMLQDKTIAVNCRFCGEVASELPGGMLNSIVIVWFAVFSFFVSIISLITDFMKKKNVNHIITMIVHFALSYIAFFFIFIRGELFRLYSDSILFTGNGPWITAFALTIFFIGAYILIFGIRFLWYVITDNCKKKKQKYEKIYSENENNAE